MAKFQQIWKSGDISAGVWRKIIIINNILGAGSDGGDEGGDGGGDGCVMTVVALNVKMEVIAVMVVSTP